MTTPESEIVVTKSADRASLKSASSVRKPLHEMLAVMEPISEEGIEKVAGPPLDYTFRDLRKVTDICKCEPREGPARYVTVEVMSNEPEELRYDDEKDKNKDKEPQHFFKYCTKAIRLSNNSISKLQDFNVGMKAVLENPDSVEWIDLSFNDLTKIDDVVLDYPNLKVLYLHANYIDDLKQVSKLASLPHLKALTLHGNMIEEKKGYRQYVITSLPQIQYLDFSRITKADRDKAQVWKKLKLIDTTVAKKKPKSDV